MLHCSHIRANFITRQKLFIFVFILQTERSEIAATRRRRRIFIFKPMHYI